MRSAGKDVGGEHCGQSRGSGVGIDVALEDPIHGDAGNAVVAVEESEPAYPRSREADVCSVARYLDFRESPGGGPRIGPVNPVTDIAHGRRRIINACGTGTAGSRSVTTGHIERIDDDMSAARGRGAGCRDYQGVSAGCEIRGREHGLRREPWAANVGRAGGVDRARRAAVYG